MSQENTIQVGDITVRMFNGKKALPENLPLSTTMDWSASTDEMGRDLRSEVTTVFLANQKAIALPIHWKDALNGNKTLKAVAAEVAGSVLQIAERRRVKDASKKPNNPFTLIFVSTEKSANKDRAIIAKVRRMMTDSHKVSANPQNKIA